MTVVLLMNVRLTEGYVKFQIYEETFEVEKFMRSRMEGQSSAMNVQVNLTTR